jgi:hypothetical protein
MSPRASGGLGILVDGAGDVSSVTVGLTLRGSLQYANSGAGLDHLRRSKTQGLDLLGLRGPVQQIGNGLLNGLTSVTPKLRYLSVLSWIVWRYAEARLPDDDNAFTEFAAAQARAGVAAPVASPPTRWKKRPRRWRCRPVG